MNRHCTAFYRTGTNTGHKVRNIKKCIVYDTVIDWREPAKCTSARIDLLL
jgi:hypothetical protein